MTPFDQSRIAQLISSYAPDQPPSLPMDFGDYLSLLWWIDHTDSEGRARYYRRCADSLATALGFADRELGRLVRATSSGTLYNALSNMPYRYTDRAVDAADRRAAIQQLLRIRADVVSLGASEQHWSNSWPGSGIIDQELHERVFAILFAALPSQYPPFARLLLVTDIVLHELLLGVRQGESFLLYTLITQYAYPDPASAEVHQLYLKP
jgi:hypothetical protein